MTSYTRPDKTRDKFDAQIWVVYYAFRDEFIGLSVNQCKV